MTMIEIIAGEKGKGKTKELLAKVNHSVTAASGNIVYHCHFLLIFPVLCILNKNSRFYKTIIVHMHIKYNC